MSHISTINYWTSLNLPITMWTAYQARRMFHNLCYNLRWYLQQDSISRFLDGCTWGFLGLLFHSGDLKFPHIPFQNRMQIYCLSLQFIWPDPWKQSSPRLSGIEPALFSETICSTKSYKDTVPDSYEVDRECIAALIVWPLRQVERSAPVWTSFTDQTGGGPW